MHSEILVIAEHSGSEIDAMTHDLIAWGAQVAAEKNWKLGVLVAGCAVDGVAAALRSSAADHVYTLDDPALKEYNPCVYVDAIAGTLQAAPPRLILLPHSYTGIELGGGLAARLNASLWSNCLTVKAAAAGYTITRPIAGGAFVATLELESRPCNLVSLQRGAAPLNKLPNQTPQHAKLAMPAPTGAAKLKVTGETKATFTEDITKAHLVVTVGRGVGDQSRLPPFVELAQALGGVIAASRPIIDMGWMSVDHQVGLSGRTVRPKVYLAFGISGSAQHLAGMRDSGLIIAINNDPNAPIFQIAHFGIVADIFDIAPALIEQAKLSAGA